MKKKTIPFIVIAILFINQISFSQTDENLYLKGIINVIPDPIEIIIIVDNSDVVPVSGLYIPQQFVFDMKAAKTEFKNDSLHIYFKRIGSDYYGVWNADSSFYEGYWKQGGKKFQTNLKNIDRSETANFERPQSPKPPYSYIVKDYKIENKKGNCVLAGTLTIPDTTGAFPLVVLISGSGAQDRNEEIAGHKPFLIIADYLTKNGIAVFRYDDRGFGESTGDIMNSTSYDFMTDALAVIKYFETNPNIDKNKIGVAGHSEGGLIAMMLAAKFSKNIDFIISLAGPGVDSKTLLIKQIEDISLAAGIDEKNVDLLHSMQLKLMNIPEKSKNVNELRKKISNLFDEYGNLFTDEQKEEFGINQSGINSAVMQFSNPWIKYFLTIDPAVYLIKVKCPVLALNGSKDIQVSSQENLAAIEKYLSQGKCENYQIKELHGLNHLFQHAETGQVQEYFNIQESISPDVLPLLLEFINSCQK